jgi:hypothetical protein
MVAGESLSVIIKELVSLVRNVINYLHYCAHAIAVRGSRNVACGNASRDPNKKSIAKHFFRAVAEEVPRGVKLKIQGSFLQDVEVQRLVYEPRPDVSRLGNLMHAVRRSL